MTARAYGNRSVFDTPLPAAWRRHIYRRPSPPVRKVRYCRAQTITFVLSFFHHRPPATRPPRPRHTPPPSRDQKAQATDLPVKPCAGYRRPCKMACLLMAVSNQLLVGPGREGGGQTPNPPQLDTNHDRSSLGGGRQACGSGEGGVEKVTAAGNFEAFSFRLYKREIGKHGGGDISISRTVGVCCGCTSLAESSAPLSIWLRAGGKFVG